MITGDLDLERTVWDVEYRRQVIAFLADYSADGTKGPTPGRPAAARSAEIIPFPCRDNAPAGGKNGPRRRAAES